MNEIHRKPVKLRSYSRQGKGVRHGKMDTLVGRDRLRAGFAALPDWFPLPRSNLCPGPIIFWDPWVPASGQVFSSPVLISGNAGRALIFPYLIEALLAEDFDAGFPVPGQFFLLQAGPCLGEGLLIPTGESWRRSQLLRLVDKA